jgi:hypothetical protein
MYSELTALLRSQGGKGRAEMLFPFIFVNIGMGGIMSEKIIGVLCVVATTAVVFWIVASVMSEVCK